MHCACACTMRGVAHACVRAHLCVFVRARVRFCLCARARARARLYQTHIKLALIVRTSLFDCVCTSECARARSIVCVCSIASAFASCVTGVESGHGRRLPTAPRSVRVVFPSTYTVSPSTTPSTYYVRSRLPVHHSTRRASKRRRSADGVEDRRGPSRRGLQFGSRRSQGWLWYGDA
jgi:hypothetical protein